MASRTALVTGASRGIGRGIAIELGRAGYRVAINYAGNAEAAAEALALVQATGSDGFVVQGDVAVAADRARLVAETVARFGRIDLLVNNAGVAPKVRADLLDAGEESFDRLFAINLKGPYFLSQLAAKQMLAQAPDAEGFRGRIVNITSVDAFKAHPRNIHYAATKAAVVSLTRSVADHVAPEGILVNSVAPAGMATDKARQAGFLPELAKASPLGRGAQPREIAEWVLVAGGPKNTYMTGENIIVSGGYIYA